MCFDNYFNNCCGLVLGLLITGATCTLLLFLVACKISCLLWKFLIRCLLKPEFGGFGCIPVGFVILLAGSGLIEWLARSGLDLMGWDLIGELLFLILFLSGVVKLLPSESKSSESKMSLSSRSKFILDFVGY